MNSESLSFLFLFIISIFYLIFITTLGFYLLRIFFVNKEKKFFEISSIVGLCLFINLSSFLYFFLNLSINQIIIFYILLFIFFLLKNLKNEKFLFIKSIINTLILTLPVILIFILLALFYGEQFYIFRGNYWDYFYYIKKALVISNNNFDDLEKFNNLTYYLSQKNNFINGSGVETVLNDKLNYFRPAISLLLSFFLKLKFANVFQITWVFVAILLSLISISFSFLFLNTSKKNNFFLSIISSFSFWCLYVFEISALAQLLSLSIFIATLVLFFNFINSLKENNYNFFVLLAFLESGLLLVYPEFFLFNLLFIFIFFLFLLFVDAKLFLIKKRIYFFTILIFFIFSLPGIRHSILNFIESFLVHGIPVNDFWGYYGAFFLGRDNLVTNISFVNEIKEYIHVNNGVSTYDLAKFIINLHSINHYIFIPANFIPSFFGLYFLTPVKGISFFAILNLFAIIIGSAYLIKVLFRNIIILISVRNNFTLIFFSIFFTWFISSLILLFSHSYWGIIKLYLYFFILFYLLVFFYIKKNTSDLYLKPNKKLLFLLLLFPIYKYSNFNFGVGRHDSFPSVLDINQKKEFSWKLDINKLVQCNNVMINVDLNKANIPRIYYLKLNLDHNNINYSYSFLNNFKSTKDYYCEILIEKNSFIFLKK